MRIEVAQLTPEPLDLVINGEEIKLTIDVLNVADSMKVGRLQREILEQEDLTEDNRNSLLLAARVVGAVKDLEGAYYWEVESLLDLRSVMGTQAGNFWVAMANAVSIVNPVPLGEGDLEDRKK